jgi:hypothetical protein
MQFDDSSLSEGTWIQAIPLGEWQHPVYGKLKMTFDKVSRMAANWSAKIRGQDLDIDYDHKAHGGDAAGWVALAEARPDGLWLKIRWTATAFKKLKEGAYRYFSPEYQDQWKHPQTGVKHRDVLFGGAITNRPYLKGIQPINLAEFTSPADTGGNMDRDFLEAMAKKLGVTFDSNTTDEQLKQLVAEADVPTPTTEPPAGGEGGDGNGDEGSGGEGGDAGDGNGDAGDVPADLVALAETNPHVRLMLAERETQNRRIAALETANRLSETNRRLSEVGTDEVKLTPSVTDDLRKLAVKLPVQLSDQLFGVVNKILSKGGTVQLGELGRSRGGSGGSDAGDPGEAFEAAVTKYLSEHKDMDYADATVAVAAADPNLFDAYREASFEFKE